jgi:hypothetical protein
LIIAGVNFEAYLESREAGCEAGPSLSEKLIVDRIEVFMTQLIDKTVGCVFNYD